MNFENDDHANEAKKKKENSRVQWLLPGRCTFNRSRSNQTKEETKMKKRKSNNHFTTLLLDWVMRIAMSYSASSKI